MCLLEVRTVPGSIRVATIVLDVTKPHDRTKNLLCSVLQVKVCRASRVNDVYS